MIFRLALKDILHDWLLSLCLVLAISSIIAPLLILFGLKFGTIQTLRSRLIQDPKNREIRPLTTKSFQRDWFEKVKAATPEISFIVPMTRQISSSVTATHISGAKAQLSLMATAEGDPLLLENGVGIPDHRSCVLTEAAAQDLEAAVGDELTLSVRRIIGGSSESGDLKMRVAGILEARASGLKTAFVQLEVVEAMEDYKDGRAVSEYGWSGELSAAYPLYDGAAVFTPEPLSKLDQVLLTNNTGFSRITLLEPEKAHATLGYRPNPEWTVYLVSAQKRAATSESIQAVRNKLRGKGAVVIPWVKPLEITLTSGNNQPARIQLHAISKETGTVSTFTPPTRLGLADEEKAPLLAVLVPADFPVSGEKASLSFSVEDRQLSVPVSIFRSDEPDSPVFATAAFSGMINLLRYRNIKYDAKADSLLLSRRGYAGFRMYTRSIDQVEPIQQQLEEQGITVHTEQERIGEVRRLDKYMTLIFWLIASVGVVGGISALTASLYASVERKKRELNMLRLLGLLKREIVLFPVFQGLLLSSGGLLLAGLVFSVVSAVINRLFSSHLRTAESLCTLSVQHFIFLALGVFVLSNLAATIAALRATRLDPAEALRDE